MKLIIGLLVLIAYHQAGEALMLWMEWPIPGSVVGMLLLFISLLLFNSPPKSVQRSAEFLMRHLALFFVPAGVGLMLLFDLLKAQWLAMLVSMVLSTFISLIFTALVMQLMLKVVAAEPESDE